MANIGDFEGFAFGVYLRVIREGKGRKEKKKEKVENNFDEEAGNN